MRKSLKICFVISIYQGILTLMLSIDATECNNSPISVEPFMFNLNSRLESDGFRLVYPDNSSDSSTRPVPPSVILSSCQAFIDKYAAASAGFTKCSIENARPLRFCEKCIDHYILATSIYEVIMKGLAKDNKGQDCGYYILNADKIQLIAQTENFIKKAWSDASCEHCFSTTQDINGTIVYVLKNDTVHFHSLFNSTLGCFLNNSQASIRPFQPAQWNISNNTVCQNCIKEYRDINDFYVHMEDKYYHSVCIDVVDMMNYTRRLWSGDFECTKPKGDIVLVIVLSVIFASLPVGFYIAAKIYGTKQEHKIIRQKRYGDTQNPETSGTARS